MIERILGLKIPRSQGCAGSSPTLHQEFQPTLGQENQQRSRLLAAFSICE